MFSFYTGQGLVHDHPSLMKTEAITQACAVCSPKSGSMSLIAIFRKLPRLYHIHRITRLAPFVRVIRGKYGRRLRRAILVEDKGKQIVAVSFALETESSLRLLERRFSPALRRSMLLTCLDRNFFRVESRATLVLLLYGDAVIQVIL
jgi:hypothetical protein